MVHYTAADLPAIPTGVPTLDLFDVFKTQYLQDTHLQALHINNFRLKTLYKNMCKRLSLPNLYDVCQVKNGMEAWIELEKYVHESNHQALDDVVQYNEVDCVALACLHLYMTQTWDQEWLSYHQNFSVPINEKSSESIDKKPEYE